MHKNTYPFYHSIRFKIISLLIILTLIPLLINVYIWHSMTSRSAESEAINNTTHLLKVSNDIFESALKDTFGIVSVIALDQAGNVSKMLEDDFEDNTERYLNNREMEEDIRSISGVARAYYSGLSIINANGDVTSFGVTPPYEASFLSQYSSEIELKSTNMLITIPHHFNEETNINDYDYDYNDMLISIVRPVFIRGEYKGMISGNVWCNLLLDIFDNSLEKGTEVVILDSRTRQIIFSSESNTYEFDYDDVFINNTIKNTPDSKGYYYMTIKGIDYLCVYQNSDYTGWTSVGLLPKDHLMDDFNQTSRSAIAISIIFTIIAVILAAFVSIFFTNNIKKLNTAMSAVDENNLDIHVEINAKDEIGHLFDQYTAMIDRIKNLISNVKVEEHNKRHFEIQALQSQINPHFLYNTLNSIKFLASMQGITNIQDVSEALSVILHTYMNNETIFLTIDEELNLLEKYSLIQSYKYANINDINIDVEEGLRDYIIPKLLLQPLVENCFIHGFSDRSTTGTIWLSIRTSTNNSEDLVIQIKDNGIGFDVVKVNQILMQPEAENHIGIYNVNRRIKMYFGEDYGLRANRDQNQYSIFELTLPKVLESEANDYV